MRGDTVLDREEAKFIKSFSIKRRPGECMHDIFLEDISKLINNSSEDFSTINILRVYYPNFYSDSTKFSKYSEFGNYRTITDPNNTSKSYSNDDISIYAYFDYPINTSALYVATFNNDMKKKLFDAVIALTPNFRTTELSDNIPLTMKVNIGTTVDLKTYRMSLENKISLIYHREKFFDKISVFDVFDMSMIPEDWLDQLNL